MNMEDDLLKQARALYKDRLRIALSAMLIVFTITCYAFYNLALYGTYVPSGSPSGSTQGFAAAVSFNAVGFIVSIFLMALVFRFWSWAFLPGPAAIFTLGVLEGILGPKAAIEQVVGKRFKVMLENGMQFEVSCRTRNRGTDEWFSYRLVTSPVQGRGLKEIALRHGFALKDDRFVATVSSDELHQRTLLLTKAMMIANKAI